MSWAENCATSPPTCVTIANQYSLLSCCFSTRPIREEKQPDWSAGEAVEKPPGKLPRRRSSGKATRDLDGLTNRVDKYISKYEMDTERSERGSLIIYLDKVSRSDQECVRFKIHQNFEVGILQPAMVSIYEYYAMGNTCTKFYHPTEEGGELKKICREAECHCISERCNLKNSYKGKLDSVSRVDAACLSSVDFVYETKVTKIEKKGAYDVFFMTITQVVKLGSDEIGPGTQRQFYSHMGCRDAIKVQEGRSYLIWGHRDDIWEMKKEKSYVINGGTWFEIIPTKRECATTKQDICEEIYKFMEHLSLLGCSH